MEPVPVVVANWILNQGRELPRIQNFVHETRAGFLGSAQPKPTSDGKWYIEVGDNQERLLQKGRRLLDVCGFSDIPLQVMLENREVLVG